jgi:hypothetical protein
MKILKSQLIGHSAKERLAASATLLARSCFVVSTKLNLHPAQLAFLNFSYLLLCSRDSCAKE